MNLTLFDLDGTLIDTDSDHAFGDYLVAIGWADGVEHRRRNDAFYSDYLAGRLDIHAYIDFATSAWRDRAAEEVEAMRRTFMRERIERHVGAAARALVQRHRDADDRVAIVTATNDFITRPIADVFGIQTLIATELERDAKGRVTGRIHGVPAYREGKVARVQSWLDAIGCRAADFARVTVYGDSTNDLPLLEWCSHPVATNPAPALEALALERGWPILRLFDAPP
jgi:HAD superfamily hydrolase (TIGR01490 family)